MGKAKDQDILLKLARRKKNLKYKRKNISITTDVSYDTSKKSVEPHIQIAGWKQLNWEPTTLQSCHLDLKDG